MKCIDFTDNRYDAINTWNFKLFALNCWCKLSNQKFALQMNSFLIEKITMHKFITVLK